MNDHFQTFCRAFLATLGVCLALYFSAWAGKSCGWFPWKAEQHQTKGSK